MPPLRGLTEAQRKANAKKRQEERISKLLNTAVSNSGYNQKQLAQLLDVSESSLSTMLNCKNKSIDLYALISLADAVNMPDDVRCALLGSKTKCRFDY